jgi:hypothetical protein
MLAVAPLYNIWQQHSQVYPVNRIILPGEGTTYNKQQGPRADMPPLIANNANNFISGERKKRVCSNCNGSGLQEYRDVFTLSSQYNNCLTSGRWVRCRVCGGRGYV